MQLRTAFLALAVFGAMTVTASATPIIVAGPSPAPPFGGTVINFDGRSEGELIGAQYAASGVTFTQPDGGRPMIDNETYMYGYTQNSGTGVLTGSTEGGEQYPTVAGLIADFSTPVTRVAAFLSDWAPLGGYTVYAYDSSHVLLESFVVNLASLPTCQVSGCGLIVGFEGLGPISSVQFGPSSAVGDAFAIDDLRFESTSAVPDPGSSLILLGLGLSGLGVWRKRR